MNSALLKSLKELEKTARSEEYIPTDLSYFCAFGHRLDDLSKIDMSKSLSFSHMFTECINITDITVPLYTSNSTYFESMFYNCSALITVPNIDTSNGVNFSHMFYNCSELSTIPKIDTGKGANFSWMFRNCYNLSTIPELDTSAGTDFSSMFAYCQVLKTIPELDTSAGTNFNSMFDCCEMLTEVPKMDINNATNVTKMFNGCSALTSVRVYNIRLSLQLGASTYWGTNIDQDSLIHTLNELCTVTSQQTLTLATASKTTLSSLYCKVIDNTSEKKPMVLCESTDDGAMTINEYVALKNWKIA